VAPRSKITICSPAGGAPDWEGWDLPVRAPTRDRLKAITAEGGVRVFAHDLRRTFTP
jgi:hypothetical protein